MKKYIIITNDIHMLGGGQLYTFRKAECAENMGYTVHIFYYDNPRGSQIYIKYFEKFADKYFKQLAAPLYLTSHRTKEKVLQRIKDEIDYHQTDEIIFESNTVAAALWCEFLSEKLRGKHLCYLLGERFLYSNSNVYDFFYHKYQQNQLFGTNEHSLPLLFKSSNYETLIEGRYLLARSGNKTTEEERELPFSLSESTKKICIFGRLDKHFVIPTVRSLISYFQKNSEMQFSLIVIGGTDKKKELKPFEFMFKKEKNSAFFCTGPICPVPVNWLKKMDVIIATAESVRVAAKENPHVISMCIQNDKPFGIYNYTTRARRDISKEELFPYDLEQLLDMILKEGFCEKHPHLGCIETIDINEAMRTELCSQIKLAEEMSQGSYFSFSNMRFNLKEWLRFKIYGMYILRMLYHRVKLYIKNEK